MFLDRPFNLNRNRVRPGTTILSSHKGFDQVLTVGVNKVLAQRLGANIGGTAAIEIVKGYKGDPEREIGLVAELSRKLKLAEFKDKVSSQFSGRKGVGQLFNAHEAQEHAYSRLALGNVFDESTINRVVRIAKDDPSSLLYVTGQPRTAGLGAAKRAGVCVLCLGHKEVEEWAIKYLAECVRHRYGDDLEVTLIMEVEESVVASSHKNQSESASRQRD